MVKCVCTVFFFFFTTTLFCQKTIDSRVSRDLHATIERRLASDSIDVSLHLSNTNLMPQLSKFARVKNQYRNSYFSLRIKIEDLAKILTDSSLQFVDLMQIPKEELTTGAYDLSLNKVNYVHSRLNTMRGDSMQVIVKERLFDTTDIDLKNRIFFTGAEAPAQTAHASLMATMIAGGANTSPYARGIAWKSKVGSSSFFNLFPEADSIIHQNKVSVQNHSYGTVVQNFYGNEAAAYDMQSNLIPELLHVFSAGNDGNLNGTTGTYAGVGQFANLTGNFKQAKNIMTVGSVDSSGMMLPLSSKGPAYDGRVKPELVAYGEDGSSGAAATVSGTALLIQDAYRKQNGRYPPASLVKAALANSADDIGTAHVDYYSGFGNLNAFKAMTTIMDNRYAEDVVLQGEVKMFLISVPAGIASLKITLAWNDPAAMPNVWKSLINDLDLQLRSVNDNQTWLPWVLDHSPNAAALQAPAQRKKDSLNNIEQVTIKNPVPGNYFIEVRGAQLLTGQQNFTVAWQMDSISTAYLTFPTSTDPLVAGNTHWLRWETEETGPAVIEYATSGQNWRLAGTVPELKQKYFRWQLPDTASLAVLRMVTTAHQFLSDTFVISPQPAIHVGFNCADSFLLYWKASGAGNYRIYELGDEFLEPFHQTNDTAIILHKLQAPSLYYAVAPLVNDREGIKSYTINYPALGPSCYLISFYLQSQSQLAAVFTTELGSLFNVVSVSLEKRKTSGYELRQKILQPSSLSFSMTDSSLIEGENHYRLKIELANGTSVYSDVLIVYHWTSRPVMIYPNPAYQNSNLNIVAKESGRYRIQILEISGRLAYEELLVSTLTKINAGLLAKGMYFVRIVDREGGATIQKLLVQ